MLHQPQVHGDIRREPAARGRDREIAELARAQYGVVSRAQLIDLGLGAAAIDHRLRAGRLHVVHRSVYAVGHRILTVSGRWMAAILSGGPQAALSHRPAGQRWGLGTTAFGAVDVSVPRRKASRRGVKFHEVLLPADEVTVHEGIPVTTVARTLLDLAAILDLEHLEQAIAKADQLQLTGSPSLPELMERYPRRRGSANLRRVLGDSGPGGGVARSELEIRFLRFLRRYDLPRPEVNVWLSLGGRDYEVDCLWREARLVAELDSRQHHLDAVAFETDRARDRALTVSGFRCIRVTWRQLHDHDVALASDLRSALAR